MSCLRNKRKALEKIPEKIEKKEEKEKECLIIPDGMGTGTDLLLVPIGQLEGRCLYIEGSTQDLQEYQAFMQAQGQPSGGSGASKGCLGA